MLYCLFCFLTCQSETVIATFYYGTSILLRHCKCLLVAEGNFLSDFTQLFFYLKEKQNYKKAIIFWPTSCKRGRGLSLLNDGLSKQMRNQNVCVVICGFRPLFACHYCQLTKCSFILMLYVCYTWVKNTHMLINTCAC